MVPGMGRCVGVRLFLWWDGRCNGFILVFDPAIPLTHSVESTTFSAGCASRIALSKNSSLFFDCARMSIWSPVAKFFLWTDGFDCIKIGQ